RVGSSVTFIGTTSDDFAWLTDTTIGGALTCSFGAGDNALSATTITIGAALSYTGTTGDDTVTVQTNSTIGTTLTANVGAAVTRNTVNVTRGSRVGSFVSVTGTGVSSATLHCDDWLNLTDAVVGTSVTANLGDSVRNDLTVANTTIGTSLSFTGTLGDD